MSKPCPPEVIEAGRQLIMSRRSASAMSEHISAAMEALHPAIDVMVKEHGAKAMQAGSALASLRQAQAALGLIMQAHNSLRLVLEECDVEQPTDDQVLSIR